jgi:hypothetical protein
MTDKSPLPKYNRNDMKFVSRHAKIATDKEKFEIVKMA